MHENRAAERQTVREDSRNSAALPSPLLTDLSKLHGRIGVFGGSFDPITDAHVLVAKEAKRGLDLDAVVFMPAAQNPLKLEAPRATGEQRLRMIVGTLAGEDGLYASADEIHSGDPSYTVTTLLSMYGKIDSESKLFLIVGADCLTSLDRWHEIDLILSMADVVAVGRPTGVSAEQQLARLSQRYPAARFHFLPLDLDISSTRVREQIVTGDEAHAKISPITRAIIEEEHLYRPAPLSVFAIA